MNSTVQKSIKIILISFVVVLIGLGYLIYNIHRETRAFGIKQFKNEQDLLAKQMAIGIEEKITLLEREIDLLAKASAIKQLNIKKAEPLIRETFGFIKNLHVTDITILNAKGIVTFSLKAVTTKGKDYSRHNYYKKIRQELKDKPVYEYISFSEAYDGQRGILIALPILGTQNTLKGVLVFTIAIKNLFNNYSLFEKKRHIFWFFDSGQRILFHPDYSVGTKINTIPNLQNSFKDIQAQFKSHTSMRVEYVSANKKEMIAVIQQLRMADQKCYFVIATPKEIVSKVFRQSSVSFGLTILFLIILIIVMILGTVYFISQWNKELKLSNEQLHAEIFERQQAEEKIQKQNAFLHNILESLTHPFYVIDARDYTVSLSNTSAKNEGIFENNTCYFSSHKNKIPCGSADHPCPLNEVVRTKQTVVVEHVHRTAGTGVKNIEVHGYPILDKDGNVTQMIIYSQDVTDRKKAENQIRESLKEKEVLLGEIHHRVKNNLQVIYSLLSIQTEYVKQKKYCNILKDCQNQILSMAQVHEKLYRSKNLSEININEYITDLAGDLFASYKVNRNRIKLNVQIEQISFGIDTAIHCGLLINELLSNALKHAFPDERMGSITIRLIAMGKNEYELIVSDNGIGLPKQIDINQAETFGLQLVQLLAEGKLKGTLKQNPVKGTEFQIHFIDI